MTENAEPDGLYENLNLTAEHRAILQRSSISQQVASDRGYRSVTVRADLQRLGFSAAQCRTPALLIPIYNVRGELALYQLRPDEPRIKDGRPLKYEARRGSRLILDPHPTGGTA